MSVETWETFRNMLCQFFFCLSWDLKREKPVLWKAFFLQNKADYAYKLRVQDFVTGKNFSFNQYFKQESFAFFWEKLFYKSNRELFPVFVYPDINTPGVGGIDHSRKHHNMFAVKL